jgi:hypothetical protein
MKIKNIPLSFIFLAILFTGFLVKIEKISADSTDINLTIRNGNDAIFSGAIPLPPVGSTTLADIDLNSHDVDARSVLSIMHIADTLSDDFSISNLTYFSSFGSLYLNCITLNSGKYCDDWQYVVNDIYPFVGMDQNILSGGENLFIYYGPQTKISLSSDSINTSENLTVKAQGYDYKNNLWIARTGVTAGLTQPNPSDPWSPIEISTSPVDANGEAVFSSISAGLYNVGIKEDFYFPTKPLTVVTTPYVNGGSSVEVQKKEKIIIEEEKVFDIEKALNFLSLQQKTDGSFGESMYTDWATIAFASSSTHKEETLKLVKYFSSNKFLGNNLTDFERHAMALLALGMNPYDTNGENYIKKITNEFDGVQFGDPVLENDDIFALIVLENAGFTKDDKIISATIDFILSKQKQNGSFGESIDMTGAGIQALSPFKQEEKIKNALEKARNFLKENQEANGGWKNVSATAWAINGLIAIGENPLNWKVGENTPFDYIAKNQDTDGGIKNTNLKNKIWETAYAIVALSDRSWNELMTNFEKIKDNEIPKKTEVVTKPTERTWSQIQTKNKEIKTPIIKKLEIENTASVINALPEESNESPYKKRSWLRRLFDKIGNIFF